MVEKGEIHLSYLGSGVGKIKNSFEAGNFNPDIDRSWTISIIISALCFSYAVFDSFIREIYTHILIQPNVIQ